MIGNFQFNDIKLSKLIDDGLHVVIKKWEKPPVTAIFTANVSGERFLTSYGHNLNIEINIFYIPEDKISEFTDLTGVKVDFKLDENDTIVYNTNCVVNPFNADGRPFYNAVNMKFTAVTGNFETVEDRISAISPVICRNTDVPNDMFSVGFDSLGNEFITEYF